MNVVKFWREYASQQTNSTFSKEDFRNKLEQEVPDWKEQVRNEDIWPELHSQANYVNEVLLTDVIIEEAGLEYAFYLVENQWGKRHLDASRALDYCTQYIVTDWNKFPQTVQDRIINYHLKEFLGVVTSHIDIYGSLHPEQTNKIVADSISLESSYLTDILMFNLWREELNFRDSPYVSFINSEFIHFKEHIRKGNEQRHISHLLEGWDKPQVQLVIGNHLNYQPSERIENILQIALLAHDDSSCSKIKAAINEFRHRLE